MENDYNDSGSGFWGVVQWLIGGVAAFFIVKTVVDANDKDPKAKDAGQAAAEYSENAAQLRKDGDLLGAAKQEALALIAKTKDKLGVNDPKETENISRNNEQTKLDAVANTASFVPAAAASVGALYASAKTAQVGAGALFSPEKTAEKFKPAIVKANDFLHISTKEGTGILDKTKSFFSEIGGKIAETDAGKYIGKYATDLPMLGKGLRKVPVIGGVINEGYVIYESASLLARNEVASSAIQMVSGTAQSIGTASFIGIPLGELAAEGGKQLDDAIKSRDGKTGNVSGSLTGSIYRAVRDSNEKDAVQVRKDRVIRAEAEAAASTAEQPAVTAPITPSTEPKPEKQAAGK